MKENTVVELVLCNGDMEGVVKASLFNKTIQAIKIPRKFCANFEAMSIDKPGIIIFATSEAEDDTTGLYIRTSSNICKDIQHYIEKYRNPKELEDLELAFYSSCIWAFTGISLESDLSKLVDWLEKYFKVGNLEYFKKEINEKEQELSSIAKAKLLDIFEDIITLSSVLDLAPMIGADIISEKNIYTLIDEERGVKAKGIVTSYGIMLLKNSVLSSKRIEEQYKTTLWYNKRDELQYRSIIKGDILQEDTFFNNPRFAECVILGEDLGEPAEWITYNGQRVIL